MSEDIVERLKNERLAVFGQGKLGPDDLGFFETEIGKEAAAENERLRAELAVWKDKYRLSQEMLAAERERCAQIAEQYFQKQAWIIDGVGISAAIRRRDEK